MGGPTLNRNPVYGPGSGWSDLVPYHPHSTHANPILNCQLGGPVRVVPYPVVSNVVPGWARPIATCSLVVIFEKTFLKTLLDFAF